MGWSARYSEAFEGMGFPANFNEATVGRLLGHEPSNVTGNYGTVPWSRLVDAIHSL